MIISEDQANQIARCIVFDIQNFIEEHQTEYELFLDEELNDNEINQIEYEKEIMLIEALENERKIRNDST